MARVLVTGAGGFVCRHIVNELLRLDHSVIAVDRLFDADIKQFWSAHAQIELIEGSIDRLPAIEADVVIHGAAVTASPEELGQTPVANLRANLDPLLYMLDWLNANKIDRSIFISSSAVFRETPAGPVHETDPANPLGLYAVAKVTMETLIETLRQEHGLDALVIRLSNIYGPMEAARSTRPNISIVGRMVNEALTRGTITVNMNEPARDWTLAGDIGRVTHHLIAASNLPHALYQVASGQVLAPLDIAETICKYAPSAEIVRVSEPFQLARLGYLSNQRLRQDTGFDDWTAFERGIETVIDWQREKIA